MSDALGYFEKYILELVNKEPLAKEQQALAFTAEKIQEIYHIAYRLYRDQHYGQALPFFRLLTVLGPYESKYWKALGACSQMQNDYEHALRCYICAQILHKDLPDPYLYVYAADCYFALEQTDQGLKALEGARLSAEEANDEKVLHHVELMRKLWSNKPSM